ncbi:hypothetical protein GYA49_04585 [Candidatus Beckwithbacteria bacterium]|nr:hypothetical protein [Candidatus Beckwithbacteria bacterium]
MKSKFIIVIVFLLILGVGTLIFLNTHPYSKNNFDQKTQTQNTSKQISANKSDDFMTSLLDGYPQNLVPLYKSKRIESIKYFVNDDPVNIETFLPTQKNYYNVVFASAAEQIELLNYYRSLMNEANEDTSSDSRVEGTIGSYIVSVSDYGDGTSYLQVYVPEKEFTKTNKYYADYPNIIEIDPSWQEHENSYGKLNQNGGEIEYTQYWTVDKANMDKFIQDYKEKYADNLSFSIDENNCLRWEENNYAITLTFSKDHGRVYAMFRRLK